MKIKRFLVPALLAVGLLWATAANAQSNRLIAIFPMKNLTGEVIYDDLSWKYTDSLISTLNKSAGAGTIFRLVPSDEIRDQMLAQNVDVKSPSYETDVWKLARLLGAQRIVWGTYFTKYDKVNFEIKVIDMKTLLPDQVNIANKIRAPYADALSTVAAAAAKILPGL